MNRGPIFIALFAALLFAGAAPSAYASLSLTAGTNATTTPNVATSITGFQIVGPAASTTPVKLRSTNGTLSLSSVSGVTMTGNNSGTVNLSGTVEKLNTALASLTYTRGSTGTDTLEVSLVEPTLVFFEGNGHLYEYISYSSTWNQAKSAAEALTRYGATGYLATITSADENAFVTARLANAGWMGASDVSVEGAWRWVTGPENGTQFWSGTSGGSTVNGNYANWGTGEPNNSGEEDCAQYLTGGTGKWNDLPCSTFSLPGYVAEFGAPGNEPTVIAQNISIVTADVPALSSLSPANSAASVSPSANLVLEFTKSVSAGSGNILIKSAADDSTIATIDVTGGEVTGGGTDTITINPASNLPEGAQLYVLVPTTAFVDGSANAFSGILDDTSWAFTIADVTAPQITSLEASAAATTSLVSWTTNEAASTRLWYSADTALASSTSETNTGTRVTSHSVSLSRLVPCTLYSYRAVSRDAAGNAATSSTSTFLTTGCSGGVVPTQSTTTAVSVNAAATTTLTESGRTLRVETPANFTATTSSVVIQIKSVDAVTVLAAIGMPSSLEAAATVAFDVRALIDNTTELESFDAPVTITYQYTDEDIAGLDESSLTLYHYRSGTWEELDSCTVYASQNTITCEAPHFSIFAIFGSPAASGGSSSGSRSGSSITERVRNLASTGNTAAAAALMTAWPKLFPAHAQAATLQAAISVRDLELGMIGEDVRALQQLLNAAGFPLAESGIGAPGSETDYFGSLTKNALSAYQAANSVSPAIGYFGPITRAAMSAAGISGIWW